MTARRNTKPAAEHSVVYDKKTKKVYLLTDPRSRSVELKSFVDALNDAEEKPGPQRFEIASLAKTRHYGREHGRSLKPSVMEQAYDNWVREHPEFRMELVWSYSCAEFSFGFPRNYQVSEGADPEFGLLGSVQGFAQRAMVEEDVARAYIRARMVELVGEAFVKKHAPELGAKPA